MITVARAEIAQELEPVPGFIESAFNPLVYHAAAAGILHGAAGEAEFADDVVRNPELIALRDRVTATPDGAVHEDQADVTVHCRDGRKLHVHTDWGREA